MQDFKTPKAWCPSCHERLDGCGTVEDEASEGPGPGDFSICLCCSSLLRFQDDMTLRVIENKDMEDMDPELKEKTAKILLAVKSMAPIMKERVKERRKRN